MSFCFASKKINTGLLLGIIVFITGPICDGRALDEAEAMRILTESGIRGGVIVHLGCGDGEATAAFRANERYLVHGLDTNPKNVEQARRHIQSIGLYGEVSIDRQIGDSLPYTDNLVNLLVVEELGRVPMTEVTRVLCPSGVAYIKRGDEWERKTKSQPDEIDDWTHTLYDTTNNAVSEDSVVSPPYHIQWAGEPRRARQHERFASISAVVSAGGRVYSIQDEGPISSIVLPADWYLAARDAFNGVILWKKKVGPWEDHLRSFRSGPPEISRRLVAVDDRVFVTLGYGEPVSLLDGSSGERIREYRGTANTSEILYSRGILYLVVDNKEKTEAAEQAARRGEEGSQSGKRIMVLDAESGELLWEKKDAATSHLMPTTLAVHEEQVFFQNSEKIVCLNAKDGEMIWETPRPVDMKRPGWSTPTLVVYENVVLSADRAAPGMVERDPDLVHKTSWVDAPAGMLFAFSAETGEQLWSCRCLECFNAPVDVLVANGLVWSGELVIAKEPGITVGRDPLTGEIKRERPDDQTFFQVGMPHHRCYRNRATHRYLILGRAGVEFVDVTSGEAFPNHWIRGTCQYGILPANGLLYVPPHSCACYSQAKLNGFYGLAPKRKGNSTSIGDERKSRLEKGPSYGATPPKSKPNEDDWPTYRHDGSRSGSTETPIPAKLESMWKINLDRELSAVTIAEGRVFVATIDNHTVHALDAESGQPVWDYTAGGRVDSPPTIYDGYALFGSADGYVYCLRASDGSLVWRFRAAPEDRRIVSYDRLESTWPVHGSVLVRKGVVYFAAGRCSYLDGGIYLYGLDVENGEITWETVIDSRDQETGRQPKGVVEMFDLPGALPGVLTADADSIYMRHMRFDFDGNRQEQEKAHLFSPTGLLDDTWWHRSYWIFGTRFYTGYRDWFRAGREVPGGRILVADDTMVYGFGRKPSYFHWKTPLEYHLFAARKDPQIVESPEKQDRLPEWGQKQLQYEWTADVPIHVRGMVLADDRLVVAGPPDIVDENEAHRHFGDAAVQKKLAQQAEAFAGKSGGLLRIVSISNGEQLLEKELDSPPVWDGMAVADERLYLATVDGNIICFGKQQ